jgi:lipopolysaccharide biosynthesis protein
MTENKAQLSSWIEDIVAIHKAKRKFVSLKDMESEDADQFLIGEFKGYDFEILAN